MNAPSHMQASRYWRLRAAAYRAAAVAHADNPFLPPEMAHALARHSLEMASTALREAERELDEAERESRSDPPALATVPS